MIPALPDRPLSVAVVGSRSFDDRELLERVLDHLLNHLRIRQIVSGGARGADALAEQWARERGIPCRVYLPDWQKHGRAAGPIRNRKIVRDADLVVAFWDGQSRGTKDTIEQAERQNVPVIIIRVCQNG